MRYEYLLLCLVLATGFSPAHVTAAEKKVIVVARSAGTPSSEPAPKPTAAPLLTSSPPPLVTDIKQTAAPTKAPAVIANEPPKPTAETKKKEVLAEKENHETLPLPAPPSNASDSGQRALPKQANALLVTGFITENGNIYEVTDKNGIGLIEPRQSPLSEPTQHVCNYGAIVIYSDVPCNEANVRIGDGHHKIVSLAPRGPKPEASQQSSTVAPQVGADKNVTNSDANSNSADLHANNAEADAGVDDTQPEPPKKRRRVNKNSSNKRRRNGSRPNSVRQVSSSRRRQQAEQQEQRRRLQNNRKKQQQRRRVQQQQEEEPFIRRSQYANDYGQRRRGSSNNRKRYVVYDYYDY